MTQIVSNVKAAIVPLRLKHKINTILHFINTIFHYCKFTFVNYDIDIFVNLCNVLPKNMKSNSHFLLRYTKQITISYKCTSLVNSTRYDGEMLVCLCFGYSL